MSQQHPLPLVQLHITPLRHHHMPGALLLRLFPSVLLLLLLFTWCCRKAYVASDELMDFLQDTVAKAPDLPPEGEPDAPKAKRQR
jgi:hypothetical protein